MAHIRREYWAKALPPSAASDRGPYFRAARCDRIPYRTVVGEVIDKWHTTSRLVQDGNDEVHVQITRVHDIERPTAEGAMRRNARGYLTPSNFSHSQYGDEHQHESRCALHDHSLSELLDGEFRL